MNDAPRLIVDGRRVNAGTGGRPFDPGRPVVVLIHGAGMDRTVWALQARSLAAAGCAVLAVDLPGHGESEGPPMTAVRDMADWLVAALDVAGIERATVAGHSMGAAITLSLAAHHGDRVRAIGLVAISDAFPVNPALLSATREDVPAAAAMIAGFAFGPAAQLASPVPGVWQRGAAERLIRNAPAGALAADFEACAAWSEGPADAAAVRCPATFVLGAADRMTPPKAGLALASLIDRARVEMLPGIGHMLMQEAPDAVSGALRRVVG